MKKNRKVRKWMMDDPALVRPERVIWKGKEAREREELLKSGWRRERKWRIDRIEYGGGEKRVGMGKGAGAGDAG